MYWIDTPGYLDVRISVFLLQFFIIDILFRPRQCLSSALGGVAETGDGLRQVHNIKECVGGLGRVRERETLRWRKREREFSA